MRERPPLPGIVLFGVLSASSGCRAARQQARLDAMPAAIAAAVGDDDDGFVVVGPLDERAVTDGLWSDTLDLRACHQQALRGDRTVSGLVVVYFVIDLDGAVSWIELPHSTLGSPAMEACITDAIGRLRFPAPVGAPVGVSTRFLFSDGSP